MIVFLKSFNLLIKLCSLSADFPSSVMNPAAWAAPGPPLISQHSHLHVLRARSVAPVLLHNTLTLLSRDSPCSAALTDSPC